MLIEDPILHIGVDIATKRDSSAVAAVYKHPFRNQYHLWGCRIFNPPVNIHKTVVELLLILLEKERIAQIQYDPYQFASEAQRLADAGFERMVREVNQQTEMVEFANTLDAHIKNGTLLLYPDSEMRSHFSWASAQHTERGWRIIKRRQSRQIDAVVAIAMALSGATADVGYLNHPVFNEEIHSRSLVGVP